MKDMITRMGALGVGLESDLAPMQSDIEVPAVVPEEPELDMAPVVSMEQAFGVYDRLSRLAATLESMAQTDGMSDTEFALFNHAVGCIVGDAPIDTAVPSMESFSTASARIRNAQVAVESVGDKLKATGEWVTKKMKEFIEWLKGFFNKMTNKVERIEETIATIDFSPLGTMSTLDMPLSSIPGIEKVSLHDEIPDRISDITDQLSKWNNQMLKVTDEADDQYMSLIGTKTASKLNNVVINELQSAPFKHIPTNSELQESAEIIGGYCLKRDAHDRFSITQQISAGVQQKDLEKATLIVPTTNQAEDARNKLSDICGDINELRLRVAVWSDNLTHNLWRDDMNETDAMVWHVRKSLMQLISGVITRYVDIVLAASVVVSDLLIRSVKFAQQQQVAK